MKIENRSLLISIDAYLNEEMKFIRGEKVLLDIASAKILEIELKQLLQKINSHRNRFPNQFMIELSKTEINILFPSGTRRKKIYAFTWGGLMMLAGLLKSKRAIEIHLQLIRRYGNGLLEQIDFGN